MSEKLNGSAECADLGADSGTPSRAFPYANWGPGMALAGVLLALLTGVVLSVPALIFGTQHGGLEKFSTGSTQVLDEEQTSAVAIDPGSRIVYAAQGSSVAAYDPSGIALPATPFGSFESAHGVAVDGSADRIYVSDRDAGTVQAFLPAGPPARIPGFERRARPPPGKDDFEPMQLAADESSGPAAGDVYVIDRGNDSVDRFAKSGAYLGQIGTGQFDFGGEADEYGIAVQQGSGAGAGDVYVVSHREGGAALFAFGPEGKRLWTLPASPALDPCGVAVAPSGRLWIAGKGGGAEQYMLGSRPEAPPIPTGRTRADGVRACQLAIGAGGSVFVAREVEPLTTTANVFVQLMTAVGFLMVPFLIAMQRGASFREAFGRLGLLRFKPSALLWIGAAILVYLVAVAIYTTLVGEPKQEDIAKGFGIVPVQILLIVIAAPISEEICFRGMLFGGLRERLPRLAAALISALIFGGLHATTGVSAVPPLIVFGFLLALLYEKTGSVIPGILLHMLNNSVALLGQ